MEACKVFENEAKINYCTTYMPKIAESKSTFTQADVDEVKDNNETEVKTNKVSTCLKKIKVCLEGSYECCKCGCVYNYYNKYTFCNNNDFALYNLKIKVHVPCLYTIKENSFCINNCEVNVGCDDTLYVASVAPHSCLSFSVIVCSKQKLCPQDLISKANVEYSFYSNNAKFVTQDISAKLIQSCIC